MSPDGEVGLDDKTGIAIILWVVEQLLRARRGEFRPVHVLFTLHQAWFAFLELSRP